jgi:hypothetical protein
LAIPVNNCGKRSNPPSNPNRQVHRAVGKDDLRTRPTVPGDRIGVGRLVIVPDCSRPRTIPPGNGGSQFRWAKNEMVFYILIICCVNIGTKCLLVYFVNIDF